MESELKNEGVKVVRFEVFEDEWESEVVEGDAGSVHMGKEGGGEGGRHVSDDGVVGNRVGYGETEQDGGSITWR
ncbi:restriction endonuclease subunit [Sesbania bispinosa]|nr:restriction endonuclease subunit [Sesbania bispinosa]